MTPGIDPVKPELLIKVFNELGYYVSRIRGSHHVMKKEGAKLSVVIPIHGSNDVPKGIVKNCIKNAGITNEKFLEILNRV